MIVEMETESSEEGFNSPNEENIPEGVPKLKEEMRDEKKEADAIGTSQQSLSLNKPSQKDEELPQLNRESKEDGIKTQKIELFISEKTQFIDSKTLSPSQRMPLVDLNHGIQSSRSSFFKEELKGSASWGFFCD